MLDKTAPQAPEETKRQAVLEGAMALFLAHGFKRVTMEDIASAAGMSRPALYLVFRNKTDVYRALAEHFFQQCEQETVAVLAQPGLLSDRLTKVVNSVVFGIIDEIETTPHGAELLDLKSSLAQDLIEHWIGIVSGHYADAIEQDAAARGVDLAARGLSADGMANMLICCIDGTKHICSTQQQRRTAVSDLIRIIELAIA